MRKFAIVALLLTTLAAFIAGPPYLTPYVDQWVNETQLIVVLGIVLFIFFALCMWALEPRKLAKPSKH